MNRPTGKGRFVEFGAWQRTRRGFLSRQVELLAEHRGPRTHPPRSEEEWRAILDGVRAERRRREAGGRWTWVGPRRVVIAPSKTEVDGV